MRKSMNFKDRLEFCGTCSEEIYHWVDGKCCSHTGQPIFLMSGCPMGNDRVRTDLDPCYYWFINAGFAKVFCNSTRSGYPCQFNHGGVCHSFYGTYQIEMMQRCPLPRLDADGRRRQPRDVYPILRD
jgi:hypothetical protein